MKTRMNFRLSEEAVRALNGLMVSWGCTGTEVVERAILSSVGSEVPASAKSEVRSALRKVPGKTSFAQRIPKPSERGLV